eukprot:CAMPEP_0202492354 /NCGR_PEP_ID=MMETSP1361-20130828/9099_1 /ASSEMBLY_ACC=CAM_ASM_000849 /TAXON_ID=210615 /ORGANISM="Staurosira complex sp., Strain CCMP2646" /LENGTH=145 /DNA_ID=CAMNT_0049122549 /DNA_START=513 /DNA_END=950 /DNA_ORIENTATION=-
MRAQSREQDQEDQDKREAFSNMTYDQYQAECTASESKIRSLEVAASRRKDADLSETKEKLEGTQHEAKKAKQAAKRTKDSATKKLESKFDSAASASETTRNEMRVTDLELVAIVYWVLESSGISRVNLMSKSFCEKSTSKTVLWI